VPVLLIVSPRRFPLHEFVSRSDVVVRR